MDGLDWILLRKLVLLEHLAMLKIPYCTGKKGCAGEVERAREKGVEQVRLTRSHL